MTAPLISAHSGEQLRADAALRVEIAAIYGAAFSEPPYRDDPTKAAAWSEGPLRRHSALPGFHLVTASIGGERVGFCYGALGSEDSWFVRYIREQVPPEIVEEWIGGHGELVELAVRAEHRGAGIGGMLHDAVVDHLAGLAGRLVLVTQAQASAARALYARRGWRDLAELTGDSRLMGLVLGEWRHTAPRFGAGEAG